MLAKLSILLTALLSGLDPVAAESLQLVERIGHTLVEAAEVEADAHSESDALAALQVELLPDAEGAYALAERLELRFAEQGKGLSVFVETAGGDAELPPAYRVGIGPFDSFEDAEQARVELAGLGIDGFVRELTDVIGC